VADEIDRLRPLMDKLWAETDGAATEARGRPGAVRRHDDGERMLRYEKANSAEVHRCLNLLFKKQAKDAKLREQACDLKAERRELAREVVDLLRRRKARRAAVAVQRQRQRLRCR